MGTFTDPAGTTRGLQSPRHPNTLETTEDAANTLRESTWSQAIRVALDGLVLTCFLAAVLVFANKPGSSADEDLWWHARTGNWIMQHQAVPT